MVKYGVVDIEKLDGALIATADAIRQKTGKAEMIEWKENGMADEINTISTGVDVSNDTVSPDTMLNGITAHDSTGEQITGIIPIYNGAFDETIEVLALQEKIVVENGEVTPDNDYDGLSKVIVKIPNARGVNF